MTQSVSMAALAGTLAGRRVFVTGHTGFKGAWLCLLLARLGARVSGYALAPEGQPTMFEMARVGDTLEHHVIADIRDQAALTAAMREAAPELVLHLAAQALVRAPMRASQSDSHEPLKPVCPVRNTERLA